MLEKVRQKNKGTMDIMEATYGLNENSSNESFSPRLKF